MGVRGVHRFKHVFTVVRGLHRFIQVYTGLYRFTQVYKGLYRFIQVYTVYTDVCGLYGCTRVYTVYNGLHRCTRFTQVYAEHVKPVLVYCVPFCRGATVAERDTTYLLLILKH